eukprot:TRINITY_DN1931_c0_g1_i1.p1 TRINITY_DN1931_c0_g1~~TRINITY_DN1931_c0_g1_i1.p1  ORF type:complete len:174 (+),score=56.16 TRINITY_DN1931_c0_g1_i1:28-522(+)
MSAPADDKKDKSVAAATAAAATGVAASVAAAGAAANDKKKRRRRRRRKGQRLKFTISCTRPVEDGIMDPASLERFLHEKIKVNGKPGMLADKVSISREKTKIQVVVVPPFSKRYLKYLTKKFLKKQQLRDWLRVVAVDKATYELKYFNISEAEDMLAQSDEGDE